MLLRIPERLSFAQAAAIPEVFFTAWDALCEKGSLRPGDTVLIHAAGSGVGTAAIQLAGLLGAGHILATTRSPEKARLAEDLGADRAIVTTEAEFDRVVLDETHHRGAEVILDFVGAPYLEKNLRAAALEGRIVFVSWLGGPEGRLPIPTLLSKRLRLVGTTLRSRPLEEKMLLTQRFAREVLPHFAEGRLRVVIDRSFPFEEVAKAHSYMEENRNFGKIVLAVRNSRPPA